MRNTTTLVLMCAAALSVAVTPVSSAVQANPPGVSAGGVSSAAVVESAITEQSAMRLGLRGVHFVPNQGQWSDEAVHYGFRSRGMDIAFRDSALTMHLKRELPRPACMMLSDLVDMPSEAPPAVESLTLTVTFPGSRAVMPVGVGQQTTQFNYFVGDDPSKWRNHVPSFGEVVYHDLYDGIDLHVTGSDEGVLKYEFHCAPGSDHEQIRIHYDGIDGLRIDETGNLRIETRFGTLSDGAPIVWQEESLRSALGKGAGGEGDLAIPARFQTLDATTYTMTLLKDPDPARPLIIDPEVLWMTYLGGSSRERAYRVAVDSLGGALVTGTTQSPDFEGRSNGAYSGWDGFVLKVDASGQMQWMTYLGGSGWDEGLDIALDSTARSVITGETTSSDFAGATNSFYGEWDGFALQIDSAGVLQWMIYLGGTEEDHANGIAIDGADNVCVTGQTHSFDFAGARNSFHDGGGDAFALKLNRSGELQWMMYLGGRNGGDRGYGVTTDGSDHLLITGDTRSTDFTGATNSLHGHLTDAFALKLSPSGEIQWMIYLGGNAEEYGRSIACDGDGNAFLVGQTASTDFEGRNNPKHGNYDGYLVKVDSLGERQWMTYVGGAHADAAEVVAVDSAGDAMVAGQTLSIDFAGRGNTHHGGDFDGFALKVRSNGALRWMTYLGGSGEDVAQGVAVDAVGDAFVAGSTDSAEIEGKNNTFHGGEYDSLLFKLRETVPRPADITDVTVTLGSLISGGVPELRASDDEYVRARSSFGFSADEPNSLVLRIGAVTDAEFPGTADLRIESRVDVPSGTARVWLRNWTTNRFEMVHVYAVEMSDTIENISGVGLGDHVRAADGRIELSLHYSVLATYSSMGFDSSFDHVTITVN